MPLTVNVGLSRKASENYQSTGTSINLTVELDQALLARPEAFQDQIDAIYRQAEAALDRQQAGRDRPAPQAEPAASSTRHNGNGNGGNGNGNGGSGRSNGRAATMTQSQSRAIHAIASRLGIDPATECRDVFGWQLEQLTVREASELIDHLKGQQQPAKAGARA